MCVIKHSGPRVISRDINAYMGEIIHMTVIFVIDHAGTRVICRNIVAYIVFVPDPLLSVFLVSINCRNL
jgi:hypothetical protein